MRKNVSRIAWDSKRRKLKWTGVAMESWPRVTIGLMVVQVRMVVHRIMRGRTLCARVVGIVEAHGKPFVAAGVLKVIGYASFESRSADQVLVDCDVIEGSLPFCEANGIIRVLKPI